jgi:penicillin-binding protein 1C
VTLPSFTPSGLADVPLQLRSEPGALPSRQIGTPGAAFLIADMLKETGRLPSLARLSQSEFRGMTAFKTGTSFGLRDAWTVAYTPDFTAAIWFGRENGGDDPSLIGLGLAAPAAVGILHALNRERRASRWFQPPEDVARTMVCSLSGAAPSPYCPATRSAWHIPAVWATRPCALHVFRDGKNSVEWPPELEDFNRKRFAGEDLSRQALIVSPMPGARYLITPGARRNPLPLKAEGVSYPVHWYVDGEYQGLQTRDDLPLYWRPAGGDHFVSLLDADERESGMAVRVTDLSARVDEAPLAQ